MRGGPIVTGTIREATIAESENGTASGRLAVSIRSVLRGDVEGSSLELSFEHLPPSARRRPQPWDDVPTEPGRELCVIVSPEIAGEGAPRVPLCVFELDDVGLELLAVLDRMVELESAPDAVRVAALDDRAPALRALATHLILLPRGGSAPDLRTKAFEVLAARARRKELPRDERLQAIHLAGIRMYDAFEPDDPTSVAALSLLGNLLADETPAVRREAATILDGYLLGGGTRKPAVEKLEIDRVRVLEQLRRDAALNEPFAPTARALLDLFERKLEKSAEKGR